MARFVGHWYAVYSYNSPSMTRLSWSRGTNCRLSIQGFQALLTVGKHSRKNPDRDLKGAITRATLSFQRLDLGTGFSTKFQAFTKLLGASKPQCNKYTFGTLSKDQTNDRQAVVTPLVTIYQRDTNPIWEITRMFAKGLIGGFFGEYPRKGHQRRYMAERKPITAMGSAPDSVVPYCYT